jgi:hypothetical protein
MDHSKMTPGFTMSNTTRPISIGKFQEAVMDKGVVFHSVRLLEEMKVFIWKNGRAEAQSGYNDDLVMSFGIGMLLRDTSLKFQQQGLDMTRAALNGMTKTHGGAYSANSIQNPYTQKIGNQQEDLRWLL